jgi:DNA polymerase III subunit epsilon
MGLLHKEKFVCVDCEFTGLDLENDRIIEVAAAIFTFDQIEDRFETLIDPECLIPESSQAIHNISQEMVQGKPKIQEVLPSLFAFIHKYPIIGHGISFDVEILCRAAKRIGIPCTIEKQRRFDTLRMARLYGECPVNSLEMLRKHFNIAAEGAHRAMSDVIVNIEVFKYLAKRYNTTEQLVKILEKPIKLKTMPLGKYKGRRFDEIPSEYLFWAANKDFDQDLLYSIRSELGQRKKKGNFHQASNPFSSL